MASLDFAAPKLGSGKRFAKLSSTLAARGARNPDALAAWIGRNYDFAGTYTGVIDLDWASWDAEHGSGAGSKAHDTASKTASATARATAKRHMASKAARANAASSVRGFKPKSASQLKAGHSIVWGNKKTGAIEEHKVVSTSRKPNGHVRVTLKGPDGKLHVTSMPPASQVSFRGAPGDTSLPQVLKQGGFAGNTPAGNPYGLANPDLGIYLAETATDEQGRTLTCPECGHVAPAGHFGASGASLQTKPGDLRTPAPGTGSVRKGAAVSVSSGSAAHALSNTRAALELAAGTLTAHRRPIQGPADVLVARAQDGTAVLRHRHGGAQIASLRKTDDGKWIATVNGRDLAPRDHQRTALMEAVGTWNGAVTGALHRQEAPLQPPPQQTELMAEYGIPAIRALATPVAGAGDGPRMTAAGGTDDDGLTPRGQAIKKKLIAKGFPEARAVTFAKMSQKTKPGTFGKRAAA